MYYKLLIVTLIMTVGLSFYVDGQNRNAQTGHTFTAGVSSENITPPLGLGIVGNFGVPPEAKHIHDSLYVKTLIVDDGKERLVFVVVDNIGIPAWVCDAAKDSIFRETRIPASNVLIAATHTHSSVSADGQGDLRKGYSYGKPFDDYQKLLIQQIVEGVKSAVSNLRPAEIGWGAVNKPQHVFNRRWYMEEPVLSPLGFLDSVKMNPGFGAQVRKSRPAGPIDPEVSFIAIRTTDKRALAILANYSLHYVGGVPQNDISADYFGRFSQELENLLVSEFEPKDSFLAIMSNGTSGDINNMDFSSDRETQMPYEKIQFVASDIAADVAKAYYKLSFRNHISLGAKATEVNLSVRKPSELLKINQEKIIAHKGDRPLFHPLERRYSERIAKFIKEYPDEIPITLQVFKIGDMVVSAIPFEVFAETGLEIKDRSSVGKSFNIGIANGFWGYLPTYNQHLLGGYETWLTSNIVQKDAAEVIVQHLLEMIEDVKD